MLRYAFLLLVLIAQLSFAQRPIRPKIGLVLSGGGAKGLAHIGILQAIDRAGLKIDYISGTSMGSIIGAMYAIGYSGDSIESIARNMNWNDMLSIKPSIENISIEEKDEFDKYELEMPIKNRKLQIGSGALEGEELWLKLSELFMPAYNIKDFSKFNIPFKCVATDISTGKAVILDSGEIITAVRASMSIPSVFATVDYGNVKLVDGGVVHNFPVSEVIDMGAGYVIGSNVSNGLKKADELNDALDILFQIALYKSVDDFNRETKHCDIFIQPDLNNYTAASFNSSDSIINIGKEEGKKYYPFFKHLADSLNAIKPVQFVKNRLPDNNRVIIDTITIEGRKNTTIHFFKGKLNLLTGKKYSAIDLAKAIRKVHGTTYFKHTTYSLQPTTPGHAIMNCKIEEEPELFLKAGVHYNSFSDVALITTISTKRFIFDRSNAYIKLNLSENFRGKALYRQYINNANTYAFELSANLENMKLPVYANYKETQLFRNIYSSVNLDFCHYFNRSVEMGIGGTFENTVLRPQISSYVQSDVENSYLNAHAFIKLNTLNRSIFPQKGWKIDATFQYIFNQHPNDNYFSLGKSYYNISSNQPFTTDYQRASLQIEKYSAITSRITWLKHFDLNTNLYHNALSFNQYIVGGIENFLRNQSVFAGLNEAEIFTSGITTIQTGIQAEIGKNIFVIGKGNLGMYDFAGQTGIDFNQGKLISGYSLSMGYLSVIFPVQVGIMYCDQSKKVVGSVNLGFHF